MERRHGVTAFGSGRYGNCLGLGYNVRAKDVSVEVRECSLANLES
jgi:hypothetical protein